MKKILITGAGGFIGSYLVEEALSQGFEVWAGIRQSTSRQYLTDSRIRFIDLAFGNPEKLNRQLAEFKEQSGGWDYVIHNLGATKVRKSADFDLINTQFTCNFVDGLISCDMVPDRFVYMSSLSVCGPFDEKGSTPVAADYVPQPNTAYARSKRNAELYLENLQNFPYVILRPTGVYGPRERDYFLMLQTINSGFDVQVGFRPQYLTFIYVKDLVRAAFLSIDRPVIGRTFSVSDGNLYLAKDFRQIAMSGLNKHRVLSLKLPLWFIFVVSTVSEYISKLMGKASTLNRDKYKIMKQRNWNCDISTTQQELQFYPEYNLEKGLNEAIAWYKQHKWIK